MVSSASMDETFDGILLGTGHNALVLQAYLSRAGLRTLSVDRAAKPGGGLSTMENPRLLGFFHNTHSFFHRALTAMPWYRDLELERHGARYIEPDLNVAMILRDGRVLEWWTDLERTEASFAGISKKDARALRRWAEEFQPIVADILIPEARSPPMEPVRRREILGRSKLGRRLLEVSARSPLEFVLAEFEHDAIRAGLLFFNGLREVDLRLEGFGHSIPALLASPRKAQMCAGGSARLAEALEADIHEHGGNIRRGVEVRRILTGAGRATGIELATGERILATGFVASGLNPQQTFLELLPPEAVSESAREKARKFQYNLLAPLFALHVALAEPPRYKAQEKHPELEKAFMVILGLEHFGQFQEIVDAHERGAIPPTVAWGACPTLFDSSQAPSGKHAAFLWEKVPYALRGNAATWLKEKEGHGNQLLDCWASFAPNLSSKGGSSAVLDSFLQTPVDTEEALPNMRRGDLLVGSFAGGQVGYDRPFPGAGSYRTPLEGLYLCGGSTHPGGNITGLCGYNAASVIVADLELKPWWSPSPLAEALP